MERPLTGHADVDTNILTYLSDEELFRFCLQNNRYIRSLCSNENLWRNRFLSSPLVKILAPGLTEPIQILQEIQKYGNPNITTWKQLYYHLYSLRNGLVELLVDILSVPDERKFKLIEHYYNIKNKKFQIDHPLDGNGKITALTIQELDAIERMPVILKPRIRELLAEHVLPLFSPYYEMGEFILVTRGITTLGLLSTLLLMYMEIINAPDEYYSFIYDNIPLLLVEDAAVPNSELTPEWRDFLERADVAERAEGESMVLMGIGRQIIDGLANNKAHLKY